MKRRAHLQSSLPALLLAVLASAACQGTDTAKAAGPEKATDDSQPTSGEKVVARVAGKPVHMSELDEAIVGELASLEQQIYDLRRARLTRLVEERLLQAEAEKRGISVDELVDAEIDGKAEEVTEEAMTQLYEQHRARLGGRTREQMGPQLFAAVHDRNKAARRKEFTDALSARADVEVLLPPPRVEVSVPEGSPTLGAPDAPITIVAFSDYQCPYCHRAQTTVEDILVRYEGKVKLVHMDFPLNIHPGAIPAAQAARCAGEQERFWDYHRDLLSQLTDFSMDDLLRRAKTLRLEEQAFQTCLSSGRYEAVVDAGFEQGQRLGVSATPTFFINGRRLQGALPIEAFAEVIDEELALTAS
jgi:protein-disulfide isomerase